MRFKKAYIEISNICNVQCSFCPVVVRDKQILDVGQFEHVLKQVKPFAEEITMHLMGEPLAHPHFEEMLSLATKHQVKVNLTSNGILVPKYANTILEAECIRQVNFSLHSYLDNFPNKDINLYLEPILNLSSLLNQTRDDVYVNYRLWNLKDSEVIRSQNERIMKYIEGYLGVSVNSNVDVGHIKSKRITGKIYYHFDSQFKWPSLHDEVRSTTGTCHGLRNQIAIHANGDVVPCCLDKEACINLGNIFKTSFEEIINSERAKNIVEGFNNFKLVEELCQKCTFIARFDKKKK